MLKLILLIGYLMMVAYCVYQAYTDSEDEDPRDVNYIIGVAIASLLWPVIWLVMIICASVQAYYEDEEEI